MRPAGQTRLGFFPLPIAEAKRLRNWLTFPDQFSAVDPCVGDGAAFAALIADTPADRYGIEIGSNRSQPARTLGIETIHAQAMDVRCRAESVSLLYLNPPYVIFRTTPARLPREVDIPVTRLFETPDIHVSRPGRYGALQPDVRPRAGSRAAELAGGAGTPECKHQQEAPCPRRLETRSSRRKFRH